MNKYTQYKKITNNNHKTSRIKVTLGQSSFWNPYLLGSHNIVDPHLFCSEHLVEL